MSAAAPRRPDRPHQPRAVRAAGGRLLVPANRWDLAEPAPLRPASVVIPYYEDPTGLDRLLASLRAQTVPPAEVVVVDDGSSAHPAAQHLRGGGGPAGEGLDVVVRTLPDRGFRAAAARNAGADAATGDVLVFLDGDVVADPGLIAAITALPSALPDALVVGRRLHADLDGLDPDGVLALLSGPREGPRWHPEPAWLVDGYTRTADLRHLDVRSWRLVISAVMALDRALFADLGGFDAGHDAYGGEDWQLAHRALHAGAVLAHRRDAVVLHDGPDLAGRDDPRTAEVKADEVLRLLPVVTDRTYRPPGLRFATPRVLVTAHVRGWGDAEVLRTVDSLLAAVPDAVVHLLGRDRVPEWAAGDLRVRAGEPPTDPAHVEVLVDLTQPVTAEPGLADALAQLDPGGAIDRIVVVGGPAGGRVATLTAARTQARIRRAAPTAAERRRLWRQVAAVATRSPAAVGLLPAAPVADLEAHLDRPLPPRADVQLERVVELAGGSGRAGGDPGERPVLALSAGWRSGSTLLQRLLMSDPDLWVWGEPWDRAAPLQRLHEQLGPIDRTWPGDDELAVPDDPTRSWIAVLSPSARALLDAQRAYLRTLMAPPAPATRWGLKEVRLDAGHVRWLLELFPAARVVLLVRDPVDAWASYAARGGWWWRWPDDRIGTAERFAARWAELAGGFADLADHPSCLLVRYEDLAAGRATDAVAAHVGATLDPGVIAHRVSGTPRTPVAVDAQTVAVVRAVTRPAALRLGYAGAVAGGGGGGDEAEGPARDGGATSRIEGVAWPS